MHVYLMIDGRLFISVCADYLVVFPIKRTYLGYEEGGGGGERNAKVLL